MIKHISHITQIIGFLCLFSIHVMGQDPVFSQFYNTHLQLNPAMAGNTVGPNFQLNYRNQWPGLSKIYNTYALSYDQAMDKLNSGIGGMILTDNAGDGTLVTTTIRGMYSYKLKLDNDLYLKGGFDVGFTNMGLDWNKLQFGDAIDPRSGGLSPGGLPLPSAEVNPGNNTKNYFTVGSGLVLYNPKYSIGISLANLNTPDISFLSDRSSQDVGGTALPVRITIHAGNQITLDPGNKNQSGTFIALNTIYTRQGPFNQLNLGGYLSFRDVIMGVGFRHSFLNGDAIIPSIGFRKHFLKLTYSFDLTTSELGLGQGGSHEIGIGINFDYLYPKKQNYNDCFAIFR